MFTVRWRLFRIFGMPIRVDASWLIILVLVTWMLGTYVFAGISGLSMVAIWALSLVTALAYFLCILLHELGHALVAKARGMSIHGITLFLLGGVAELGEEPQTAAAEFWMAIAGPAVSAALAVLAGGVLMLVGPWQDRVLSVFLLVMAVINAMVLLFNMIPAFPLDGGRVLRSILWGVTRDLRWATYWAATLGQAFGYFLIAAGIYFVFAPNRYFAWDSAVWSALIGWFVIRAAQSSYQHVVVREILQGQPVKLLMHEAPLAVPPTLDLKSWVREYVYRFHRRVFPVALPDGQLAGVITTRALSQWPRRQWSAHTVGEVMRQNLRGLMVTPDTDAMAALSRMQRHNVRKLLVAEHGQLLGTISLKDLLSFVERQTMAEVREQHA